MKRIVQWIVVLAAVVAMAAPDVAARERNRKVRITGSADITSGYVWRGLREAGISFQPSIGLQAGGFEIEAWGSVDFAGDSYREVDLKVSYQWGPVNISVNDVYCVFQRDNAGTTGGYGYFRYGKGSPHRVEAGVKWCVTRQVPVTLAWYTTLAGGSDYSADGRRVWSSYFEVSYPFAVGSVQMNAGVGMVPWNAVNVYGIDRDFYVQDIFVKAGREWPIEALPGLRFGLSGGVSWNPALADVNVYGCLSLKM